jgi:NADPH-dependent glutamate synthase beta subunit-like oxidoreductase
MKLAKNEVVLRRVSILEQEGITFVTNVEVADGNNGSLDILALRDDNDAVLLSTGATVPRDLPLPGRELNGVHFAMDFLKANTQSLLDSNHADGNFINAADKNVIVIGGGDTGTDCIGTSLRHGCKSLVNFELFPKPPMARAENNPWPTWPVIFRTDYGHEEAKLRQGQDPRVYQISSLEFLGEATQLTGIKTTEVEMKDGKFSPIPNTEKTWDADLVLLAMGFLGPEHDVSDPLSLAYDPRSNYLASTSNYKTSVDKIFTAGDCRRGQSLVVRAINEGREAAREIDKFVSS